METLHTCFSIGGPIVALLGVGSSVWGTYLLTKWYHPFSETGFMEHLKDSPFLAMALLERKQKRIGGETSQSEARPSAGERALQELEAVVELGAINLEKRAVSLVGIDLIFIGFVLQAIGATLSLADVVWSHLSLAR